jgi:trans-2-enoyl-CoA reductase
VFNFTKTIRDLAAFAEVINKRTFELEKSLDSARLDLEQTKKDLNEALDLIGRFMHQTVLVAKDVNDLVTQAPNKKPKK